MNPDQYGPDGRPGAADESPPDERALTYAMHAATRDLQPPTADLVRGGLERGRRMRAVRRVQIAGATLAVVIATGAGAFVATTGSHASGPTGTAHQPGPTAEVSGPPGRTPSPPLPSALPSSPPLTGKAAVGTLTGLLPLGATRDNEVHDTTDQPNNAPSIVMVQTLFRPQGAAGLGLVQLTVNQGPDVTLACRTGFPAEAACTVKPLPDGGTLRLTEEYAGPTAPDFKPKGNEVKLRSVTLVRADGVMFHLSAANSRTLANPWAGAEQAEPVLTATELEAIVTSPEWGALTGPGSLTGPGAQTGAPDAVPTTTLTPPLPGTPSTTSPPVSPLPGVSGGGASGGGTSAWGSSGDAAFADARERTDDTG
ncbi:hypothetical protein OG216_33135 [Streptomycetaceae bacterium NBC_01309]